MQLNVINHDKVWIFHSRFIRNVRLLFNTGTSWSDLNCRSFIQTSLGHINPRRIIRQWSEISYSILSRKWKHLESERSGNSESWIESKHIFDVNIIAFVCGLDRQYGKDWEGQNKDLSVRMELAINEPEKRLEELLLNVLSEKLQFKDYY